eukprot:4121007-Amphidinium_carterae.1
MLLKCTQQAAATMLFLLNSNIPHLGIETTVRFKRAAKVIIIVGGTKEATFDEPGNSPNTITELNQHPQRVTDDSD